jgi:HrpA-like RNA helicase
MTTPKVGNTYSGFVSNIDRSGYHIRLTGFQKTFEGLIHKNSSHLLSSSEKLTRGRCVKVEIIAYNGNLLAIELKSIENEFSKEMNEKKGAKGEAGRKLRIASPDRHQDKSYTPSNEVDVKISIKPFPIYYKDNHCGDIDVNIACLSLNSQTITFNSVVKFPNTFMFNNALKMNALTKFEDFKPTWSFHSQWSRGNILVSSKSNQSGPSPAELVQLWNRETSAKTIKEQRESLPIFKYKNALIQALAKHQFLIVQGETGSGKLIN